MDHRHRHFAAAGRTRASGRARPGSLYERQREFAEALLDPDRPAPPGLVAASSTAATRRFDVCFGVRFDVRFDVYRNNVVASLVDALASAWPITRRLVGEPFFAAMARVYVSLEPPTSPVMLEYGETFPGFIENFAPAASVPYLGSVARLERAWVQAYHAADTEAIDPAALSAVDPHRLADMRLHLHPSLSVVSSAFPVVDLWRMNVDGAEPGEIELSEGGQHAVVIRPLMEVEVHAIGSGFACFTRQLLSGATIAQATADALCDEPEFKLAEALAELFCMSAIAGFEL